MNLTISLDGLFAEQLTKKAAARNLSPEQAAREIIQEALVRSIENERWQPLNGRRVELIRESIRRVLTDEEAQELQRLEAEADALAAPFDRQLLATAERFRQLAERLPDADAS
jgi:hypothetical protein